MADPNRFDVSLAVVSVITSTGLPEYKQKLKLARLIENVPNSKYCFQNKIFF